jgi:crossover junction endodeoxyribonuclease RusA
MIRGTPAPFLVSTFWVSGMPETKGSWVPIGGGRVRADNPREGAWAEAVGWAAKAAMLTVRHPKPDDRRYAVTLAFTLAPPPNKTSKNRRDVDKLARSCLDAMTGIVWANDEQVDELHAIKRPTSGAPVGVTITVKAI